MAEGPRNIYPTFTVKNNAHPNRLLAFPILGIVIKLILLIPVGIVMIFYSIAYVFFWIVVPFYILFTGRYWDTAYNFFVGYLTYYTRIDLYLYGLTDKYPSFAFNDGGLFELKIDKPTKPKRWMAIPLIGILIRFIFLIPYLIFVSVLQNGSGYAMIASWFTVLFKKRYPESLYEFNRDTIRVSNATYIYATYLSDKYPSFAISMDHQTIKIFLIILGSASPLPGTPPMTPDQQAPYEINNEDIQFEDSEFQGS